LNGTEEQTLAEHSSWNRRAKQLSFLKMKREECVMVDLGSGFPFGLAPNPTDFGVVL